MLPRCRIRVGGGLIRREWQAHQELRPAARPRTGRLYAAAMQLDQALHQSETYA